MAGESVGELWVDIRARMDGLNKDLSKAQSTVQAWGQKISAVGGTLTRSVTLPIVAIGTAAVKASLDFNKGMANVATLIPGNVARVDELKKAVQDLAVDVGASTSDLSDGLYQVISAFGDTADSVKGPRRPRRTRHHHRRHQLDLGGDQSLRRQQRRRSQEGC